MGCLNLQLQDYFQLVENSHTKYREARFTILASHKGTKTQSLLFNDMLGTTIGTLQTDKFNSFKRDAFGKLFANSTNNEYNMFTGQIELAKLTKEPATESEFTNVKPDIEGLGYAFLFRNYRADLGKWQTADPLGYPDGWNNLAYVNNGVTSAIDRLGLCGWIANTYVRCSEGGAFASADITRSFNSTNSYTVVCGTGISESKGFSFTISASLAEWLEISATVSASVSINSNLTGAPHDGTGEGTITVYAIYTIVYYKQGWEYDCGLKEDVTYHTQSTNTAAATKNVKVCDHTE